MAVSNGGRTSRRRGAVTLLAGVVVAWSLLAHASAGAATRPLVVGGSELAGLPFSQWIADVARPPYGIRVDHDFFIQGSAAGRARFLDGTLDVAIADLPFQAGDQPALDAFPDRAQHHAFVPAVVTGLSVAFNVIGTDGARIRSLRASARQLCRLLMEPGIHWDDPALAAENPGVPLPHVGVGWGQLVGENAASYEMTRYCGSLAPDVWAGPPTTIWPSLPGVGFYNGVDNLANGIAVANGAIGVVPFGYAKLRSLPVMSVGNASGEFVSPTPDPVSTALSHAVRQPDGTRRIDVVDPDPAAYPLVVVGYALVPTSGLDPAVGADLATFLTYAVGPGQGVATRLGGVPLTQDLRDDATAAIALIPGAAPLPVVPEVPLPVLLPIAAGAVVTIARRGRRRAGGGPSGARAGRRPR